MGEVEDGICSTGSLKDSQLTVDCTIVNQTDLQCPCESRSSNDGIAIAQLLATSDCDRSISYLSSPQSGLCTHRVVRSPRMYSLSAEELQLEYLLHDLQALRRERNGHNCKTGKHLEKHIVRRLSSLHFSQVPPIPRSEKMHPLFPLFLLAPKCAPLVRTLRESPRRPGARRYAAQ
jgi:hypothetical protein